MLVSKITNAQEEAALNPSGGHFQPLTIVSPGRRDKAVDKGVADAATATSEGPCTFVAAEPVEEAGRRLKPPSAFASVLPQAAAAAADRLALQPLEDVCMSALSLFSHCWFALFSDCFLPYPPHHQHHHPHHAAAASSSSSSSSSSSDTRPPSSSDPRWCGVGQDGSLPTSLQRVSDLFHVHVKLHSKTLSPPSTQHMLGSVNSALITLINSLDRLVEQPTTTGDDTLLAKPAHDEFRNLQTTLLLQSPTVVEASASSSSSSQGGTMTFDPLAVVDSATSRPHPRQQYPSSSCTEDDVAVVLVPGVSDPFETTTGRRRHGGSEQGVTKWVFEIRHVPSSRNGSPTQGNGSPTQGNGSPTQGNGSHTQGMVGLCVTKLDQLYNVLPVLLFSDDLDWKWKEHWDDLVEGPVSTIH